MGAAGSTALGPGELGPAERRAAWISVGNAIDGPYRLPVISIRGAQPGPTVVIVAGQHGGEGYGVLSLLKLLDAIDPAALVGELRAVPCMNIDAFVSGTHTSPFDHQDMNRVHPGHPGGTRTEQIAHALFSELIQGADLVLDLHGGSPELGNIPLCRWMDGEERPSIRGIAEQLGILYIAAPSDRKIPGMLSVALRDVGIPSISIEVGSSLAYAGANADEMAGYARRVLAHMSMLPEEPLSPGQTVYVRMWGVRAQVGGVYEPMVALGQQVQRGQVLGLVRNLLGQIVQHVEAGEDGTVGVLRTGVRVSPGESLIWLLVPVPAP
ncbi:MAG TPA: succinylglutamate desuccinylase/aspartoacylase family protein [Chloroflexaceae bacterium]|nr:succinylglutamate desuccinylase/aspartoacylase family protein [Chloroflexaceae bacterium]